MSASRAVFVIACAGALLGCELRAPAVSGAPAPLVTQVEPAPAPEPAPVASSPTMGELVAFVGTCDASGAIPIDEHLFVVADDEDNVLRVYDADVGGPVVRQWDVSGQLELPVKISKKTGAPKPPPETDIEAATRLGELGLWLTSHARNSSGKLRPERFRLFATRLDGGEVAVVGDVVTTLVEVLLADPRYEAFGLAAAAELPPKHQGGLNIEGMTAHDGDDGVWIGLRSPTPGGKALVFPLLNPRDLVLDAARPELGDPRLLDLGGFGVRSLSFWRGHYLIIAGHHDGGVPSQLWTWDGQDELQRVELELPDGFNPEGFFTPEARDAIMLLSDDGSRMVDETECKRLDEPTRKQFRGLWLRL